MYYSKKQPWNDVKYLVEAIDTSLFQLLDKRSKDLADPWVLLASYKYGDIIVDRGESDILSEERTNGRSEIVCHFKSSIPLSLVLKNCVEVFLDTATNEVPYTVPLSLIRGGNFFGVFEATDVIAGLRQDIPTWSISAGARTVYALFPFDDKNAHHRKAIRKLSLPSHTNLGRPSKDAWPALRAIGNTDTGWNVPILHFPDFWWEGNPKVSSLVQVQQHLLGLAWRQSAYLRGHSSIDAKLKKVIQSHNGVNAWNHSFTSHLQQIVAISMNTSLGFEIAESSKVPAGPFEYCQEFIIDLDCSNKDGESAYPVIVQPTYLSDNPSGVLYPLNSVRLLDDPKLPDDAIFHSHFNALQSYGNSINAAHKFGLDDVNIKSLTRDEGQKYVLKQFGDRTSTDGADVLIDGMRFGVGKLPFFGKLVLIRRS